MKIGEDEKVEFRTSSLVRLYFENLPLLKNDIRLDSDFKGRSHSTKLGMIYSKDLAFNNFHLGFENCLKGKAYLSMSSLEITSC